MNKKRLIVVWSAALMVGGCAHYQWVPVGQGASLDNFEATQARCNYMARHGGSDFVVAGDPKFVAGATLGHAIGEGIRTAQDFNDCMTMNGWHKEQVKQ